MGLANMTTGQLPEQPTRIAFVVDGVFAVLSLIAVGLGVRSARSAGAWSWAERRASRPPWRNILALLPRVVPSVLLLSLPSIFSVVFGGRDGSWLQLLYVAPMLVIWLTAATLAGLAVILTRARHLASA
jgi:hypothetical protein